MPLASEKPCPATVPREKSPVTQTSVKLQNRKPTFPVKNDRETESPVMGCVSTSGRPVAGSIQLQLAAEYVLVSRANRIPSLATPTPTDHGCMIPVAPFAADPRWQSRDDLLGCDA